MPDCGPSLSPVLNPYLHCHRLLPSACSVQAGSSQPCSCRLCSPQPTACPCEMFSSGSWWLAGSWQLSQSLELKWSEGDQWTASIELPAGRIAEYKYVLVDSSGSIALAWQQGNNSVLALRQDDREVSQSITRFGADGSTGHH